MRSTATKRSDNQPLFIDQISTLAGRVAPQPHKMKSSPSRFSKADSDETMLSTLIAYGFIESGMKAN